MLVLIFDGKTHLHRVQSMQKLIMEFYSEATRLLSSPSMYVILSYICTDAWTDLNSSNIGDLFLVSFLQ